MPAAYTASVVEYSSAVVSPSARNSLSAARVSTPQPTYKAGSRRYRLDWTIAIAPSAARTTASPCHPNSSHAILLTPTSTPLAVHGATHAKSRQSRRPPQSPVTSRHPPADRRGRTQERHLRRCRRPRARRTRQPSPTPRPQTRRATAATDPRSSAPPMPVSQYHSVTNALATQAPAANASATAA